MHSNKGHRLQFFRFNSVRFASTESLQLGEEKNSCCEVTSQIHFVIESDLCWSHVLWSCSNSTRALIWFNNDEIQGKLSIKRRQMSENYLEKENSNNCLQEGIMWTIFSFLRNDKIESDFFLFFFVFVFFVFFFRSFNCIGADKLVNWIISTLIWLK